MGSSSSARRVSVDGLVEAIVSGGLLAGDTIDAAVVGIDREHPLHFGVEGVVRVFQIRDRREQRSSFEAGGIDVQRAPERRACVVDVLVVQIQLGEEHVRVHEVRIEPEHASDDIARHGRIRVNGHAREAQVRGRERAIDLHRLTERAGRVRGIVLVEQQIAPRGLHRRIVGLEDDCVAEEIVGLLEVSKPAGRAGGSCEVWSVLHSHVAGKHGGQQLLGLGRASERQLQRAELESRIAARVGGRGRRQQLQRLVVPAPRT